MKLFFLGLASITAVFIGAAGKVYTLMPKAIGNSVIAEKSTSAGGNQVSAVIPSNITEKQSKLLALAYTVAKENGLKNPEVMQAVLLQETLAGGIKTYKVANPGPEAYFGVAQIKLQATKDVLARWPELYSKYGFHTRTDDEIKANLIMNDKFNVDVASKYLLILKQVYGYSGKELLNAYNRGPAGVKHVDNDFHYAVGAEQKLQAFKKKHQSI